MRVRFAAIRRSRSPRAAPRSSTSSTGTGRRTPRPTTPSDTRDPIARYRSAIAQGIERQRKQGQYPPTIALVGEAIGRSTYHDKVHRALEIFGRERVLMLQFERCVAEPLAEMQRTHRFLGIEPLTDLTPRLERRLSREDRAGSGNPDLPTTLREELKELLAEDVRRLAQLCPEIDPGLWPNFAAR
jgi:hypothetical protein